MKANKRVILHKSVLLIVFIIILIPIGLFITNLNLMNSQLSSQPEVVTISKLEEILEISDLTTYQAIFNGVTSVLNDKSPDKIDYYVAYEGKVEIGYNLEQIKIQKDHNLKVISVLLPPLSITNTDVDYGTLDFIFINKKANRPTVTEEAYKACIDDLVREAEKEEDMFKLAEQNAIMVTEALLNPFIKEFDTEYKLVVKGAGHE